MIVMIEMIVLMLEVTHVRVLWPVDVNLSIMVSEIGFMLVSPVIRTVLNSVAIVMLINMLRVVFTIVTIRVVVTKVMVTLWLNVMILTVLLAGKMSLVFKMRYMVLQVPVSLFKMSIWVMFKPMYKLSHVMFIIMVVLVGCLLVVNMIFCCKVFSIVLTLRLGRFALLARWRLLTLFLWLLTLSCGLALLFLVVHLFVIECGLRAHVLLSLSLSLRRL